MIYRNFKDKKLSLLGFGTMRLPLDPYGQIDKVELNKMVDYAIKNGVNYFDTAYPYHNGLSEVAMGETLKKYDRTSFYLATKYPGHQISSTYNPEEIFESQLKKCQVEYFDFYLLHNVYEGSIEVYDDPKWGIFEYFRKQKELGRIKHLGISAHANTENLIPFIERHKEDIEFCQIQFNYLDYTMQDAKGKYEYLERAGIPVWVMEPLRGGKLVNLPLNETGKLKKIGGFRPIEYAFRYISSFENIKMILSGMSSFSQMKENIDIFNDIKPLNNEEMNVLYDIAKNLTSAVPCTGCGYCMKGCPIGLDIPKFMSTYNDITFSKSFTPIMYIESLDDDKTPSNCIKCGKCARTCPQKIDVPQVIDKLKTRLDSETSWKEVCRIREEAARRLKDEK